MVIILYFDMMLNRFDLRILKLLKLKFLAGVIHDWDRLRQSIQDVSPVNKASCGLVDSLLLVTMGFHSLTSNYATRMGGNLSEWKVGYDWLQQTPNSIQHVIGIIFHPYGVWPPPFCMDCLIFYLYYMARTFTRNNKFSKMCSWTVRTFIRLTSNFKLSCRCEIISSLQISNLFYWCPMWLN